MSAPESNYKSWFAKADNDLLNIENNLSAERVPWDIVCFHAQQAVEKTLKAFLVFHGRPATRTHDLIALLAASAEIDQALASLQADCRTLSYYAVASRYPDDLYEASEKDGREMMAAAHRVRLAVLASFR